MDSFNCMQSSKHCAEKKSYTEQHNKILISVGENIFLDTWLAKMPCKY